MSQISRVVPCQKPSCKTPVLVYAVVIAVIRHAASLREAPRRFIVHNTHEQIQLAAVRVVAAKGYHQTSIRDICAEANISARSFHEHFSGKEEAVFSGVEAGVDRVMGFCQEVYRNSPSWPDAVWDGMYAYAEWAKNEPAFARTGIVELLSVGPSARELVKSLMEAFMIFLQPGYDLLDPEAAGSLDEPVTQRFFEVALPAHQPQLRGDGRDDHPRAGTHAADSLHRHTGHRGVHRQARIGAAYAP